MSEIEKNEEVNCNPIYTIMVFSKCEKDEHGWLNMGGSRVVGFRHTFELAEEVVKTNMCDIWEYSYDYALIEEVDPAIYPCSMTRWFYKFNQDIGGYERIEEPECFKNSCALTIG